MMNSTSFLVLEMARQIADDPEITTLDNRKYLGIPLANEIRHWLVEQPANCLFCIDFLGITAITLSVAEELGPLLLQTIQQTPSLEHHYPIYRLNAPEPAYTIAGVCANFGQSCLAWLPKAAELFPSAFVVADEGDQVVAVLGQLTAQMGQILRYAERQAQQRLPLTSEQLTALDFLRSVSPAARSKRLSELHTRRLLAFRENPANYKERLFIPAWRLYEQRSTAQ
ncbi:MAG TPA: hypothetical protein VLA19_25520 [Herpetosiphonaceae bacterium]|nr:hypothetical protein [Herpetosiphonaceae bacterium]